MRCSDLVVWDIQNINSLASAGKMQMLGVVWNAIDPRPVYKKATHAGIAATKYESFDTSSVTSTITGSLLSSVGDSTYKPIPDLSGETMYNIIFSCNNLATSPPSADLTPEQIQQRQTTIDLCNDNKAYFCKYIQDASASFTPSDYDTLQKAYCPQGSGAVLTGIANVVGGASAGAIAGYVGLAIGSFLCACLAANQMLYMPAIMRILVFIITLLISFINPFGMAAILLYFGFILFLDVFRHYKGIYNMDQFIFPATLLPLRLRRPEDGMLIRILLAPFTYIEPNPKDDGRADYLAGIDMYLNNLQRGAKLTNEILESANLKGLKESIAKGFRDPVEDLTRLFVAKQEADSPQRDTLEKAIQ